MFEPWQTPKNREKIYYDGRIAWTVAMEGGIPTWKRIPEKDAKPHREPPRPPGNILKEAYHETNS